MKRLTHSLSLTVSLPELSEEAREGIGKDGSSIKSDHETSQEERDKGREREREERIGKRDKREREKEK